MKCRHCFAALDKTILDLGHAPPSNSYLDKLLLETQEVYYPLVILLCTKCFLVQTKDVVKESEFFNSDYAYLSSTSLSWLKHAENFACEIINELALNSESLVLEIACNDGYLLRNFVREKIPCYGIEPSTGVANLARKLGIEVYDQFFTEYYAKLLSDEGKKVDLVIGNNVYAHVPDINDFTRGIKLILKDEGVVTLECPWLKELLEKNQFDTIYHEHFSYLSLLIIDRIFNSFGLKVFKSEILPTHGGSLRIYGCHANSGRLIDRSVEEIKRIEKQFGLNSIGTYSNLQKITNSIKNNFLAFLLEQKKINKRVVGYGAAAKGNTLINYSGIKTDLLEYICDASSSKQGKFTPGSHIPILSPDVLLKDNPDYVVIFPWNIAEEIVLLNQQLVEKGVKFISFVPDLKVHG